MDLFSQRVATWVRITRTLGVISTMVLVAGCGGGGGARESASNPPQSSTANATLSINSDFDSSGSVDTTYEATTVLVDYGARAHLADVGPFPESPGLGTTIAVIDDFKGSLASTTTLPLINRAINALTTNSIKPERYSATYSVRYQMDTSITHGDLVSNIAGGYATGPSTLTLKVPTYDVRSSCILSFEAKQLSCPQTFHANPTALTREASLRMSAIPGVASEATILPFHVDLSNAQDPVKSNAVIHGHLINSLSSSAVSVINLSLGSDMPVSTDINKDIQAIVAANPIASKATAVISVAAGNSSTPCNVDFFGCNTMAIALVKQPNSVDSTIVVGALTGLGSAQKIANYSTLPGLLADRLIFASGDTGFYQNAGGRNAEGTSFAAPRVAGVAAIIKQRFPALSSDQIASIILLSADRDINNDGKPEFDFKPGKVSDPIYGRGKLSLKNALALAATY